MSGLVIIIIMIIALVAGYICNNSFKSISGEDGFQTIPGIFQIFFLVITLLNIPNPDITRWFIVGLVGTIVSYAIAIIICYKMAEENGALGMTAYIMAIMSQILIPISAALVVVMILAFWASQKDRKRKHR